MALLPDTATEPDPAIATADDLITLTAPVMATATTITVGNAADFASTNPTSRAGYVIEIDAELMLVTTVNLATNTLTVQRGYDNTTAAAYDLGTPVYLGTDERGDPRPDAYLTTPLPDIGAYQTQAEQPI